MHIIQVVADEIMFGWSSPAFNPAVNGKRALALVTTIEGNCDILIKSGRRVVQTSRNLR
jgi:hypothetical protein